MRSCGCPGISAGQTNLIEGGKSMRGCPMVPLSSLPPCYNLKVEMPTMDGNPPRLAGLLRSRCEGREPAMERTILLISQSARMRPACTAISSRGVEYVLGPEISPMHARSHCGRWLMGCWFSPGLQTRGSLSPRADWPAWGVLMQGHRVELVEFPKAPPTRIEGAEPPLLQTH